MKTRKNYVPVAFLYSIFFHSLLNFHACLKNILNRIKIDFFSFQMKSKIIDEVEGGLMGCFLFVRITFYLWNWAFWNKVHKLRKFEKENPRKLSSLSSEKIWENFIVFCCDNVSEGGVREECNTSYWIFFNLNASGQ